MAVSVPRNPLNFGAVRMNRNRENDNQRFDRGDGEF